MTIGSYKKFLFIIFWWLPFYVPAQQPPLISYVQPMTGTAASTTVASLKHSEGTELLANTIPAVGAPFAMTQWTPQTREKESKCIAPYYYKDSLFKGFRGTHWISGSCMQDYGSVTVMPVTGRFPSGTADDGIPYHHADEISTPAGYSVNLPNANLFAEVTATARCGIMQFSVQKDDSLYIIVKPNSDYGTAMLRINVSEQQITGYNTAHRLYQGRGQPAGFNGYFVLRCNKPFRAYLFQNNNNPVSGDSVVNQNNIIAILAFKVNKGEKLVVKTGTSFTSVAGAINNLVTEVGALNFDSVRKKAEHAWESAFKKVLITTGNDTLKKVFYTALYHALQHPRLFNDIDGSYPSFDHQNIVKQLNKGRYFDDFSMWDIYRAQLPLMELLQPDMVKDAVQSLVLKGTEGGWLPIFPCWNNYTAAMVGDHAIAFIASAYRKGIRDFDINAAYELMRRNAFMVPERNVYLQGKGRRALASYLKYGYVPLEDSVPDAFHRKEQVSRTLEYAYDDYALSVMAKALKKTDDYNLLTSRAANYRNVFDPALGFVNGRYGNGSWSGSFYPDKKLSFITEGTPRQYTFYVPHDIEGLAALMGGTAGLESALDSLFIKGEYWHGNEPGHHIPFLYNYTASPWKTQQEVRRILNEEYGDGPGGLSGNDDAGQMSAWYVFAAIGLYPVDPVSGNYQLASPLFDKIEIQLSNGKKWTVRVLKKEGQSTFIQSLKLNGKVYDRYYIAYSDIIKGGDLEIVLGADPRSQKIKQKKN